MVDTRCRFIVDRYSTSRSRPAHRCSKESVDGYFCARHVDTDEADMYRAHLALVEPKAPEKSVKDRSSSAAAAAVRNVMIATGRRR